MSARDRALVPRTFKTAMQNAGAVGTPAIHFVD